MRQPVVEGFDVESGFRKFTKHRVGQRGSRPLTVRNIFEAGALIAVRYDFLGLWTDHSFFDGMGFTVNHVGIRSNLAADDGLAKTKTRVNDHLRSLARCGIGREQNTGYIGRHHDLDNDGHCHRVLFNAVLVPVADGLCRPQRRPAIANRLNQSIVAGYIQIGFLLSGERQLRQVFSVCRRSDSDRRVFAVEHGIGGRNLGDDFVRYMRLIE